MTAVSCAWGACGCAASAGRSSGGACAGDVRVALVRHRGDRAATPLPRRRPEPTLLKRRVGCDRPPVGAVRDAALDRLAERLLRGLATPQPLCRGRVCGRGGRRCTCGCVRGGPPSGGRRPRRTRPSRAYGGQGSQRGRRCRRRRRRPRQPSGAATRAVRGGLEEHPHRERPPVRAAVLLGARARRGRGALDAHALSRATTPPQTRTSCAMRRQSPRTERRLDAAASAGPAGATCASRCSVTSSSSKSLGPLARCAAPRRPPRTLRARETTAGARGGSGARRRSGGRAQRPGGAPRRARPPAR